MIKLGLHQRDGSGEVRGRNVLDIAAIAGIATGNALGIAICLATTWRF
ncbi:MAG: hypothetical protein WDN08_05530 [Rhizomicrobium sp.]